MLSQRLQSIVEQFDSRKREAVCLPGPCSVSGVALQLTEAGKLRDLPTALIADLAQTLAIATEKKTSPVKRMIDALGTETLPPISGAAGLREHRRNDRELTNVGKERTCPVAHSIELAQNKAHALSHPA